MLADEQTSGQKEHGNDFLGWSSAGGFMIDKWSQRWIGSMMEMENNNTIWMTPEQFSPELFLGINLKKNTGDIRLEQEQGD